LSDEINAIGLQYSDNRRKSIVSIDRKKSSSTLHFAVMMQSTSQAQPPPIAVGKELGAAHASIFLPSQHRHRSFELEVYF